jgi:hypothetical protein
MEFSRETDRMKSKASTKPHYDRIHRAQVRAQLAIAGDVLLHETGRKTFDASNYTLSSR